MSTLRKNYFFNLIYQVLTLSIPLITVPYLSRILGADRIGEYSFAQSIVSYFSLFAIIGTSLYGQRAVAYEKARKGDIGKVFFEIVIIRGLGVLISSICYFIFIVPFVQNRLLYIVASIELVAVVFDISWFYQGIEEFKNITIYNGISKIIGTLMIFIFVKNRYDLELYVVIYCGAAFIGYIFQWFVLRKYIKINIPDSVEIWNHLKASIRLFVSQLAIQMYTILDKTMIGLITKSNYENGYYEQSQKLVKMATTIVTAIGTVMASRIAVLYQNKSKDSAEMIRKLLEGSFRLVFCMSLPITFGIILVASRFVPVFYGDGYEKVIFMISLLSLIVPAIGASNIIGIQLFVPSGRENLLTKSVVTGSCINVVLNLFLIRKYGANGAVVASIIAEYSVTAVQMYMARNEISYKKIFGLFFRYLMFAAVMFVVGIFVSNHVSMGIDGLLVIVVTCVMVYAVELFIFRDPIVFNFLEEQKGE